MTIQTKLIVDEDTGFNRWYLKRRVNVGSWRGPAPPGAAYLDDMRMLDLKTGEVILFGPRGYLP